TRVRAQRHTEGGRDDDAFRCARARAGGRGLSLRARNRSALWPDLPQRLAYRILRHPGVFERRCGPALTIDEEPQQQMVGAHLRRSLAPRLVLSYLQHPANAVGRKQLPLLPGACCSTLLGWTQSGGTIRPSARFLGLLLGRERVQVEVEASQCLTCA